MAAALLEPTCLERELFLAGAQVHSQQVIQLA